MTIVGLTTITDSDTTSFSFATYVSLNVYVYFSMYLPASISIIFYVSSSAWVQSVVYRCFSFHPAVTTPHFRGDNATFISPFMWSHPFLLLSYRHSYVPMRRISVIAKFLCYFYVPSFLFTLIRLPQSMYTSY